MRRKACEQKAENQWAWQAVDIQYYEAEAKDFDIPSASWSAGSNMEQVGDMWGTDRVDTSIVNRFYLRSVSVSTIYIVHD